MSAASAVGLAAAVLISLYLMVALLRGERF
jgi:hypothetical protein